MNTTGLLLTLGGLLAITVGMVRTHLFLVKLDHRVTDLENRHELLVRETRAAFAEVTRAWNGGPR
jgi:hypothetical protein